MAISHFPIKWGPAPYILYIFCFTTPLYNTEFTNTTQVHKTFYQTNGFKNINKSIFRVLLWNLHSNSAMEDYFSKFAKWETDTKAKTATWNKMKVLQAAKAVRLFRVSIGLYRFKTYAEHWHSSYLQINTWMSTDGHTGKQTPNYSIRALPNTTNPLQMRLPQTPHSSISSPKFIPQHAPNNVAVVYNDLNVSNIFFCC